MCRLQTFPDGLVFDGGRTDVQRMLGNAVPSLVTEVLGRAMREQFLGDRQRGTALKLLPPARRPIPAAEKVQSVPAKYRDRIGRHEDHPGEGKGAGAKRRREETRAQDSLYAKARLRDLLSAALAELDQEAAGVPGSQAAPAK
jgi:DNA (cytosine-5)-methyltransferase 1